MSTQLSIGIMCELAVDHPSGNHFYQLDEHVDNVWNDDTMRAREEPDPVMEIIETFANGDYLSI